MAISPFSPSSRFAISNIRRASAGPLRRQATERRPVWSSNSDHGCVSATAKLERVIWNGTVMNTARVLLRRVSWPVRFQNSGQLGSARRMTAAAIWAAAVAKEPRRVPRACDRLNFTIRGDCKFNADERVERGQTHRNELRYWTHFQDAS